VRDSFFDIGGNSLLAARLFTKINHTFGVELSLNSLFNSPTIEQLSAHIDSPTKRRPRHQLVPIQPNGGRTPLFWIPGGRATSVLGFRETAAHLGPDQPVYGVESRLPEPGESFESVERRSEEYLRLMLQVQPVGPYYLAGFCTGGMVVFDMAQRLRAKGDRVALLALVQAAVPGYPRTKIERFKIRFFRSRCLASSFAKFIMMRASGKLIKFRRETLQEIHTRIAKLFLGWIGTSSQLPDPTEVDNDSVANRYQPENYPGDVDIFLAEDCFESIGIPAHLDPRLRWRSLASGRIQVHTVPGDHYTMLTGLNAKHFAEQLGARLCR
jgi:thioesterase domain-containing protein